MAIAILASLALVLGTVLIHYEGLRLVSALSGSLFPGRRRVLIAVVLVFVLHVVEILLYAAGYWFFDNIVDIGTFQGMSDHSVFGYFYFSAETFTTVGFGDIYPHGPLRLIAGIEGINGLLLLGWSTSFTFLEMQRYWTAGRDDLPQD